MRVPPSRGCSARDDRDLHLRGDLRVQPDRDGVRAHRLDLAGHLDGPLVEGGAACGAHGVDDVAGRDRAEEATGIACRLGLHRERELAELARNFLGVVEVAGELGKRTFTVKAKAAGDSGRLFGSITAGDIVDAVRAAGGPTLDKRAVEVPGQIKTVGTHPVTVRLHPEVTTQVEIAVVAS